MRFVGRDWSKADIARFCEVYPSAVPIHDVGAMFGITTGKASSFAKKLRDSGYDLPKRDKAAVPKPVSSRVDYLVTENGRTYTIGGDEESTNRWADALRQDGCEVVRQ